MFSNEVCSDGDLINSLLLWVSSRSGESRLVIFGMNGELYVATPRKLRSSLIFLGVFVDNIANVLSGSGVIVPYVYLSPKNEILDLEILHLSGLKIRLAHIFRRVPLEMSSLNHAFVHYYHKLQCHLQCLLHR